MQKEHLLEGGQAVTPPTQQDWIDLDTAPPLNWLGDVSVVLFDFDSTPCGTIRGPCPGPQRALVNCPITDLAAFAVAVNEEFDVR